MNNSRTSATRKNSRKPGSRTRRCIRKANNETRRTIVPPIPAPVPMIPLPATSSSSSSRLSTALPNFFSYCQPELMISYAGPLQCTMPINAELIAPINDEEQKESAQMHFSEMHFSDAPWGIARPGMDLFTNSPKLFPRSTTHQEFPMLSPLPEMEEFDPLASFAAHFGLTAYNSDPDEADIKAVKIANPVEVCKVPEDCAICQEKMNEGSSVRKFIKCKHAFHQECIDAWLERKLLCPMCRKSVEEAN